METWILSLTASAGTKREFSAPRSLPHLLHGSRVWLCLNMMLWQGHSELLFPCSRWNTVYGNALAQTWALHTCKRYIQPWLQGKGFRDAFLLFWHSCSNLYACWGWGGGVWGSSRCLGKSCFLSHTCPSPAQSGWCGMGLPFAEKWESSPVIPVPVMVPCCLKRVFCFKAKVLCVVHRDCESQFGSII